MPKSAGYTRPSSRPKPKNRSENMAHRPVSTTILVTRAAKPSTEQIVTSAIGISGVGYAYGSRQALIDLSLEIRPGELFAVLGPNGGGKTTLFRLLSTLI